MHEAVHSDLEEGPDSTKERALALAPKAIDSGLRLLADVLSGELAPPKLVTVYNAVKDIESISTDLVKAARDKVLALLKSDGDVVSDAGALRLEVDGWVLEARPRSTKLDDKKVEALLRAKGIEPHQGMDPIVTYKANATKLGALVGMKLLTQDELESCKPELSYAVQSPKRAKED